MKQKPLQLVVYSACFFIFLYTVLSIIRICTHFIPDFSVYYTAAKNLFFGHPIYTDTHVFTGFGYPPITAFFYVPFLLLPYTLSQMLFVMESVLAAVLSLLLCYKLIKIPLTSLTITTGLALVFLSFPTKFTLGMGQSNFIAYSLFLGSIFFYQRKQSVLTTVFMSLSILIKPILMFALLFFLAERQWRTLLWIIVCCTGFFSVMLLIFPQSFSDTLYYLQHMLPTLLDLHGRGIYYNQGFLGFAMRTFGESSTAVVIGQILSIIVGGLALSLTFKTKTSLEKLVILLTVLLLLDSLSWQHHFVFLMLPFIYMAQLYIKTKDVTRLGLLLMSYFLVSGNIAAPNTFSFFPANLFLSHTLYGAFILVLLEAEQVLGLRKSELLKSRSKLFDRFLVVRIENKRHK